MNSEQIATCCDVTLRQLRHWNKLGIVGPKPRGSGKALEWSFADAVKVAIVAELRSFGVPLKRCARIIKSMPAGPMAKTKLVVEPHDSIWIDVSNWNSPALHRPAVLVIWPDKLIQRLNNHLIRSAR